MASDDTQDVMTAPADLVEIDTEDRSQTRMNAGGAPIATRTRIPLKTPDQCAVEAAKVYRLARTGRLPLSDATRLVFMLTSIGRMLVDSDLAARIEALESETKQ